MKIYFSIMAGILLLGMISAEDTNNVRNYTYGFITTIAGIVILHLIG